MIDDPDAVGEHVGFLEVLRGQEDGDAVVARQPVDLGPQRRPALDVEARGRLVEEEHARPVDERHREVEAPLHPARVAANLAVRGQRETDPRQQLAAALGPLGLRQAVQRSLQPHVLAAGEQRVERRLLQRRADRRPHLRALVHDVVAGHAGRARGRRQQRRQHQHGGGLAGAVRSQEAVDLARVDVQVDTVDRARPLLELTDESVGLDRVRTLHGDQATGRLRPQVEARYSLRAVRGAWVRARRNVRTACTRRFSVASEGRSSLRKMLRTWASTVFGVT